MSPSKNKKVITSEKLEELTKLNTLVYDFILILRFCKEIVQNEFVVQGGRKRLLLDSGCCQRVILSRAMNLANGKTLFHLLIN